MKKPVWAVLAVAAVAAAVWYAYYSLTFSHLFLNDAMDYASIGRNVARGDGFVSSYITPLGLAHKEGLPHPDLWRAPLWPAVLGLFIKILGATDQAVALATGLFFTAGAVVVCLLGNTLFDRTVGFLSALVYIFSAQNLVNAVSGMTETMSAFMMALVVYLIVASWAQNAWGDVLAGAALGLFYLVRYNALLFVPFLALLLWYRRRAAGLGRDFGPGPGRKRFGPGIWPVVRFIAAFAVVIFPWLIRNYLLLGSPFFSLQKYEPVMFTTAYPQYSLYMRPEKVDVLAFLKANPQEILAKMAAGWSEFLSGLCNPAFTGVSPYLFGLFLVSLVLPFGYGRMNRLRDRQCGVRPAVLACYLIQLAALLVIHFIYRLFFIFMPFYIIYGVAASLWLLKALADRLPVKKTGLVAVFSLLLVALFLVTNRPSLNPVKQSDMPITIYRESVKAVAEMSTHRDLIISNDGHLLAWYGDRYAAKLPLSPDMIPRLEQLAPVKFIYLTPRISWNVPEADKGWNRIFWNKPREIYGFRLTQIYPDGAIVYRK